MVGSGCVSDNSQGPVGVSSACGGMVVVGKISPIVFDDVFNRLFVWLCARTLAWLASWSIGLLAQLLARVLACSLVYQRV